MCLFYRHKCPIKEFNKVLAEQEKYDVEMATSTLLKYDPGKGFINQVKNQIYTEWLRIQIKFHSKRDCSWCKPHKHSLSSNYSRKSV